MRQVLPSGKPEVTLMKWDARSAFTDAFSETYRHFHYKFLGINFAQCCFLAKNRNNCPLDIRSHSHISTNIQMTAHRNQLTINIRPIRWQQILNVHSALIGLSGKGLVNCANLHGSIFAPENQLNPYLFEWPSLRLLAPVHLRKSRPHHADDIRSTAQYRRFFLANPLLYSHVAKNFETVRYLFQSQRKRAEFRWGREDEKYVH